MDKQKRYLLSWVVWVTILCGILVNFGLNKLISLTTLPLYLDSIGTIFVSMLCGPIAGIITGVATNLITSLNDSVSLYYSVISILIACTSFFISKKGLYKKYYGYLIAILLFAFYGGVLGTIETWFLYGGGIGSGISAPFAIYLNNHGVSTFWALMISDVLIDLLDKCVSLIPIALLAFFFPQKLVNRFPYGYLYSKDPNVVNRERTVFKTRSITIKTKIISLITILCAVVGAGSAVIGTNVYYNNSISRFEAVANEASTLSASIIDGDEINSYLEHDESYGDYLPTKNRLQNIYDNIDDIMYLYVYKIEADGCHVVFDLDTPDVPGSLLGEVIEFDKSFEPYLDDLLAGNKIDPIITNDTYGYLMSSYTPIVDSNGVTQAYVGVDISIATINEDLSSFIASIASLILSLSIFLVSIAYYFTETRIVDPLQTIVKQTRKYKEIGPSNWLASSYYNRRLKVRTGDELEELYDEITNGEIEISEDIDMITQQTVTMLRMERNIVLALANMVESRDKNTGDHIKRTSFYVSLIALELKHENAFPETINDEYIKNLCLAAPLHDVGKIKISDTILNKPGKLTEDEFNIMKTHTTEGAKIIDMALQGITGNTYLETAKEVALYHHERYDGTGYCAGLKGDDIPLSARIMAIADVFDALVSRRSYKEPFSYEKAISIIKEESGTHFDPRIVDAFLAVQPQVINSLKEKK